MNARNAISMAATLIASMVPSEAPAAAASFADTLPSSVRRNELCRAPTRR